MRRGTAVVAYRDACPHMGVPLPCSGHEYLTRDGRFIRCAQHGALFRIEDGFCVAGPCGGERLTPIAAEIRDGEIWVKA